MSSEFLVILGTATAVTIGLFVLAFRLLFIKRSPDNVMWGVIILILAVLAAIPTGLLALIGYAFSGDNALT